MGMSMHVVGFKPPDEKWKQMKAVHDACTKAGLDVPREVERFFNDGPPDENGVEVREEQLPVKEWRDESREGFELDVTKLDPTIKVVRFYCSW